MSALPWKPVDSQSDLDALHAAICWDDTQFIESYTTQFSLRDFPTDINRSGYSAFNLFLLLDACGGDDDWLEIAFVEADWYTGGYVYQPRMSGTVDSLMRVTITNAQNDISMRCARLLYRFRNGDGLMAGPIFSQWFADQTYAGNW